MADSLDGRQPGWQTAWMADSLDGRQPRWQESLSNAVRDVSVVLPSVDNRGSEYRTVWMKRLDVELLLCTSTFAYILTFLHTYFCIEDRARPYKKIYLLLL